jgi:hypothetical protein
LAISIAGLLGPSLPTGTAVAQTETQTQDTAVKTLQMARSALLGVWRGSYVCGQGETGVELSFTELGDDGVVVGTFSFFNLPGRSNVKNGEYTLIGKLDLRTRELYLSPGKWIKQPPGYTPVGFSAPLPSLGVRKIFGRITFPGCNQIYADKTDHQPVTADVTPPSSSSSPPQIPSCKPGTDLPNPASTSEMARCAENSFAYYASRGCLSYFIEHRKEKNQECYDVDFNNNTLRFQELKQDALKKDRDSKRDKILSAAAELSKEKGYRLITTEEMQLDARDIADTHEKISLIGRYVKDNNKEYILPLQDIDLYNTAAYWKMKILILTANASRALRKTILDYPAAGAPPIVQLTRPLGVVILGTAALCEYTNEYGVKTEDNVPCVSVNDGWKIDD